MDMANYLDLSADYILIHEREISALRLNVLIILLCYRNYEMSSQNIEHSTLHFTAMCMTLVLGCISFTNENFFVL